MCVTAATPKLIGAGARKSRFKRPAAGGASGIMRRGRARLGLLALSRSNTELTSGTLALSCVGAAVPTPVWDAIVAPACCRGDDVFAVRGTEVDVLDARVDVSHAYGVRRSAG